MVFLNKKIDFNSIFYTSIPGFLSIVLTLISIPIYLNNLSTQISINDSKGDKIDYWQNNSYPLEFTNYSIGSYYKITKMRNLDMNDLSDISTIINSNDASKFVYF